MPVWKIVIVTGSKKWKDRNVIYEVLDETLEEIEAAGFRMELHHGDAPGADTIADDWAMEKIEEKCGRISIRRYPADWKNCSRWACGSGYNVHKKKNKLDQLYCPTAGYRRSVKMVQDGAWRCLAFILDCSPGATHCYNTAVKAGIDTKPFRLGKLPADSGDVDNPRSSR